jgi:hypothetical protein
VSTLDELYAAVNDGSNEGTEVVIAPGTYILSSDYPNGGRLELQKDMSLSGQPGQPDLVVIDQSALPNTSFVLTGASTGGVRMGRGTNKIEWLSLEGGLLSSVAFAVLACDLFSTETSVSIEHVNVVSNGARIGIDIRNRLPEHAGRKLFASMKDCDLSGFVHSFGFALAVFNTNDASNALVKLEMSGNYIHGNKVGLITANGAQGANRTVQNSTIEITSNSDRFEGNGCGIDPSGGVRQTATSFSNNNTVSIKMHGTALTGNNPVGVPEVQPVNGALPGAIYAAGGYSTTNNIGGNNKVNNNVLTLEFWGCDISNNNGIDINAVGAFCQPAALLAGTNNLVEIYLHGVSANAVVDAINSIPFEPGGTNKVNVYR